MKISNKDVIQSYIFTTAKYDFSVYEKRILYRIVEINQTLLAGKKLTVKHKVNESLFGDRYYTIPISELLKDEQDHNYLEVKKALRRLSEKKFEYENEKTWASINIISNPKIDKYASTITFMLDSLMYESIMNFSKGFRKYELKVAMEMSSQYSMRFYELLSGQITPITFSIQALKEMFNVQEKYERINDFIRFVIEPAQRDMNATAPFSFEFKMNKQGRKYNSITFYPYKIRANRDVELENKVLDNEISLRWTLSRNSIDYLKNGFGFSEKEIKQQKGLFERAEKEIDLVDFLSRVKFKASEAANSKGYVINSLKNELK